MIFKDRFDAAHQLADKLRSYAHNPHALIVAIPRGGLELGNVLAHELDLPLDIVLTKKIGAPGNPEYAIGAVSREDVILDSRFKDDPRFAEYINNEIEKIRSMLNTRALKYRGTLSPLNVKNKIVIVVDDGIATGRTMRAALQVLRKQDPKKIVVALPVAPRDIIDEIASLADEVVCLHIPEIFYGVGAFYHNFPQVSDERAIHLLREVQK